MIRFSRSVLAVGGVIFAGGLIAFTNPKTVHALAAALVQVTNTASNPVVTQSVGMQAAQNVYLTCSPAVGSTDGVCYSISSGGAISSSAYVVPANQSLVVTAVDIHTYQAHYNALNGYPQCNAWREDSLGVPHFNSAFSYTTFMLTWDIADDTSAAHFTYPTGVVFGPSSTLTPYSTHYNTGLDSTCGVDQFQVYGYLTAS